MSLDFGNGDRIRVLIVDDSAFMRTSLARMISSEPDMEVAGTACGASDAFEKILSLDPDVITLDLVMPAWTVSALRCIMNQFPRPVIMVSATTRPDAEESRTAINVGAFDCISKQLSLSSLEITHIGADLVTKIRSAAHAPGNGKKHSQSLALSEDGSALVTPAVVAIGLSTGGPRALEQILPRFPADLPVPILIVQHMPVGFTRPLAQRLNSLSSIKVCEASHRELIRPGVAYIAPAGLHMHILPRLSDSKPMITLDRRPKDAEHVPSINVLMNAVAQVFKHRSIGVIMTGMGSDGADGMQAIFDQGGLTLGQDQASCAVYGMPRACAERGVLTRVVSLSDIPTRIVQAVARRRQPA